MMVLIMGNPGNAPLAVSYLLVEMERLMKKKLVLTAPKMSENVPLSVEMELSI